MIIYGTGSKDLGERFIPNEKCPHCGEYNKIYVHAIARYFDVFWIPIFPFRKKVTAVCHSCEKEITKEQISTSLQDKISLEKSSFKLPIYLFSGLILIGLLILLLEFNSRKHDDFVENKIHNLKKNDVLVFQMSPNVYSFGLVDTIHDGDVYFRNSNYSLNQKPSITDYEEGLEEHLDFLDSEYYFYTQSEIDSLNEIGNLDVLE